MDWNHSNVIALAMTGCTRCQGLGLRLTRGIEVPCTCVFRAVFRACYERFKSCVTQSAHVSTSRMEFMPRGRDSRVCYGRKTEEYVADFHLTAKRTLDAFEWKLFSAHFLLGADWKLCCRQLKMDRGNFFHAVYRIEEKLGQVFVEMKPYGLYPLDEYFGTILRTQETAILEPPLVKHILRPPLANAA